MGRGKDKVVLGTDLPNMSPREQRAVFNAARMAQVKIAGAAVVRGKDGNARYDNPSLAGKYHEDKL